MSLIEIVYASAATAPFTRDALVSLLARARANNAMRGLSGMLLHDGGSFLQVLEGERPEVKRVLERIRRDPRHARVTVLRESETTRRTFADWTMGFASLDALPRSSGYTDFLKRGSVERYDHASTFQLLRAFRDGRLRAYVETSAVQRAGGSAAV